MSYRNDTNPPYDITLLSGVSHPTQGHNIYSLDESRNHRASWPLPTNQQPLTDGYSPGAAALTHKEGQLEKGTEPAIAEVPWYRMRWGITAIVIVVVVIIGVIVGGAVGGTHHGSHKSNGSSSNTGASNGTVNGDNSNSTSPSSSTSTSVNPVSGIPPSSTSSTSESIKDPRIPTPTSGPS